MKHNGGRLEADWK